MRASGPLLVAATLLCSWACSHDRGKSSTSESANTARLAGRTETFTGKIVLVPEGYRLKLSDSEELVRLTRAKKRSEFVAEEVSLRKYYEKSLVVRGRRHEEWLWSAEVIGQWLHPGERRGSNLTAPPVGP